jgi:hypothetical protein
VNDLIRFDETHFTASHVDSSADAWRVLMEEVDRLKKEKSGGGKMTWNVKLLDFIGNYIGEALHI